MMIDWQRTGDGEYSTFADRKDGGQGELFATSGGSWAVTQRHPKMQVIGSGRASDLEAAKLVARLVWELSA